MTKTPELPKAALLPCPFCGSVPASYTQTTEYRPKGKDKHENLYEKVQWVVCTGCKTQGPIVDGWNHADAVAAWNIRPAVSDVQGLRSALVDIVDEMGGWVQRKSGDDAMAKAFRDKINKRIEEALTAPSLAVQGER